MAPGRNGTTLRNGVTLGYGETFTLRWGNATGGASRVPPLTQVRLGVGSLAAWPFLTRQPSWGCGPAVSCPRAALGRERARRVAQVTMVAPSSTTHSFNFNQRVVVCEIVAINYTTRTATVRTPPHPYIAPPQWYMVFALNGK